MKNLDKVKSKLRNDEVVIGSVVSLTDYTVSERLGFTGYDFLWIDAEHNGLDYKDILMHTIAASSGGAASFVRVRDNDPALVKPILDMGVDGIIFPLIKTVDDAKKAIAACTYPPKGIRGVGPGRAVRYGMDNVMDYLLHKSESSIFKILQVEHVECVNNLEEIVKVPGIDALMIGPSDLSASVGLMEQIEHPTVLRMIDKICEVGQKSGIYIGAFTGSNPVNLNLFLERGVRIICIGGDGGFLMSGARRALESVKDHIKSLNM